MTHDDVKTSFVTSKRGLVVIFPGKYDKLKMYVKNLPKITLKRMILTEHLNRKDPLPTDYSRVDEMALVLERSEIKRNEEKLG